MKQLIQQLQQQSSTYVVVLMLLVSLPHFLYIPIWSVVTVLVLTGWRLLISAKKLSFPNRYFSGFITLLFSVLIYQYEGGFTGIEAGSHLLVVMSFSKLLESRSYRDFMLLIVLSFFIISTNFLYTQTIGTAIYMVFCLYAAILCLITINQNNNDFALRSRSNYTIRLILYSLPVMIILFVFFPRVTGPLWKTSDDTQRSKTGLSDSMQPGQISQLIRSNELAFRASFKDELPANSQLYWRALTLWHYNGKKWTQGEPFDEDVSIEISEPSTEYTVTLEPHNKQWLFLLDMPYQISPPFQLQTDFTSQAKKKITRHRQYTAHSATKFKVKQSLNRYNHELALSVPELNPATKRLVLEWKKTATSDQDIVNKAKQFFKRENFYYTLSPPGLTRKDEIDQFLFETRRGFCEHYASAFATLMRHAGIPSRIVLGYLGGTFNPITRELAIDQSMAHAWTEVWFAGKGWTRVDPTAEIAPERVEENLASALGDEANMPLHLRFNFPALEKLRQIFDAIDSQWNQWVINYNKKSQRKFLKFLTGENLNLKEVAYLFIKILLTALIVIFTIYFFGTRRQTTDPVTKAYIKLQTKLARAGLNKTLNEGPRDFHNRLIKHLPTQKRQLNELFELYIKEKYSDKKTERTAQQFIDAVRQFKVKKNLVVD